MLWGLAIGASVRCNSPGCLVVNMACVCFFNRLETHLSMLDSAKKVLAGRIETMPEEALLALLEETFPYVSLFALHTLWGQSLRLLNACLAIQT